MSGPRAHQTRRWLVAATVVATAVSSSLWVVAVGGTARAPFPLVTTSLEGIISVAQVVAAVLVVRAGARVAAGALAFLAVPLSAHAAALPSHVAIVAASPQWPMVWATATASVALVAAVLVLVELLASRGSDGWGAPPAPARAVAAVGALLLAATSVFAWVVSPATGPGRFAPVIGTGELAVTVSSWLGVMVLVATAVALLRSRSWAVTVGLVVGALVTRPLAPSVLADPSWRASNMALALGWWLALAGQVVLVVCLVALVWRRTQADPRGPTTDPLTSS